MSSGDLNSTYHQAFLVSDIVSFISELAVYIIFALLLTSYIIVVWVCLKKSPSSMRSYKWFIITNATNALVFEGLIVLFQPEFLLPYPVVLINGIGKFLVSNDSIPIITYIFCDLAIITLLGNGVFVVSLFVFRYCQTTNHFLYHRFLTDMRLCIPFLVIGLVTVSLQYIVFANNLLVVPKDFLHDLKEVDPEVYIRIKGRIPNVAFDISIRGNNLTALHSCIFFRRADMHFWMLPVPDPAQKHPDYKNNVPIPRLDQLFGARITAPGISGSDPGLANGRGRYY
ncbi:serpentine type 7TM GPCR chemoreceptor srh domain-containing protein [Ditylenchus destructor]|nr:serpentine type 7TM GPCR chemoreceptor srh domain-containing protein [Ditylenchus destructor]